MIRPPSSKALTSASIPIRSKISRSTLAACSRFSAVAPTSVIVSASRQHWGQKLKLAIGVGSAGGGPRSAGVAGFAGIGAGLSPPMVEPPPPPVGDPSLPTPGWPAPRPLPFSLPAPSARYFADDPDPRDGFAA